MNRHRAASPAMAVATPHLVDPNLLPAPGVGGADGDTDDRLAATALKSIADLLA